MSEEEQPTKIMFVMRKPPHGSIYAYEGLEVILISAAYEQDVSVMFMGDGVLALKKGQDTTELGIKGFAKTYGVLEGYDIEKIYVDKLSLEERGLTEDDLVIDVEVLEPAKINEMMNEQHVLMPF
ncbi:MAG: sulfurtransferase complex subunit TusC [Spirochaetia bacterium]|nr:sulfurtransferase complex subunit TusC [Spirochaetia bacterium]